MVNQQSDGVYTWRIAAAAAPNLLSEALPGATALLLKAYGIRVSTVDDPVSADIIVRHQSGNPAPGVDPRPLDRRGQDESFRISAADGAVAVETGSAEGVFRALLSLAAFDGGRLMPASMEVSPAWAWRGLSLDVVRRWFPREELEQVIDLLAVLGLNVLHLHLTDREAWRLPIETYPALTQGSSHYSLDDMRQIVDYARDRFVTIVPEIDMPGHVAAAVAAVPSLSMTDEPVSMLAYLEWSNPAVPRFVAAVLDTVTGLFDSPYIHIGGDEAFGMPEDEYAEFVRHAVRAVRERERRPLGWQETSRADAWTPDDVVQLWVGERDRFDAARAYETWPEEWHSAIPALAAVADQAVGDPARIAAQGAAVLVSTSDPLYLDRRPAELSWHAEQNERLKSVGNGDYDPIESTSLLAWNPALQAEVTANNLTIAGFEATVWCETITSFDDFVLLLLPRLAIAAEHGWTQSQVDWVGDRDALTRQIDLWNRLGFVGFHRSTLIFNAAPETSVDDAPTA